MEHRFKPSRVLMLVENLPFWLDRRVRRESAAFQQAGYEVTVICPRDEGGSAAKIGSPEGVRIYTYPRLWEASGALGYALEYPWALFCTGCLCLFVWLRWGFDVLHVANPPDFFFLLALPFKLIGKKYVYDQHDLCPELYECKFRRRGWLYRALVFCERQSFRAADLVLVTNQSFYDIARQRGHVPPERLVIVRNGPELDRFHRVPARPELKAGFPYMALYVGIMGTQDGVDRVVHAAHHLVHELGRRDVLFAMVGDGECVLELQKLAKQLRVDQFMHFAGRISDDQRLMQYLSTADVCLAPEPPDAMNQLSTMIKVVEYMACGQPILTFDLLESRRSAGEAAMYIAEDDPKVFAKGLDGLLGDPTRRDQMSRVGLERVANLAWQPARSALLKAYSQLLDNESGHPNSRSSAAVTEPNEQLVRHNTGACD